MSPKHSHAPGFLRGALRTLLDPSIIDGATPVSRRRMAQRTDGRAARHLLDIIIATQTER